MLGCSLSIEMKIILILVAQILCAKAIPKILPHLISEHFSSFKKCRAHFCNTEDATHFAGTARSQSSFDSISLVLTESSAGQIHLRDSHHKLGIFVDATCQQGIHFLNENLECFNSSYSWLILSPYPNVVLDTLKLSRLNVDSDVTLMTSSFTNDTGEEFSSVDIFRAHKTLPYVISEYQRWTKGNLYSVAPKLERNDFGGVELVGAIFLPNFDMNFGMDLITDSAFENLKDVRWRYGISLFRVLCKIYLNCRLRLVRADCNDESSTISCNGTTGVIDMVNRGDADFGIVPFAMDSTKTDKVYYSLPVMKIRHLYLFLQPKAIDYYSALARPLSTECWILLLALCALGVLAFRAVAPYDSATQHNDGWSGSIFIIVSALSQQGFPDDAVKLTTRIIYVALVGLTFFVYIYYCTVIVNWLLLPPPQSIKSPNDLFESHFTVTVENTPYLRDRLAHEEPLDVGLKAKMSQTPSFWDLYSISTGQYLDAQDGVARTVHNPFAIFGEESSLFAQLWEVTMTHAESCSIGKVDDELLPRQASFVLPRDSPYKELLRRGIIRSYERGTISRLKQEWFLDSPACLWKHDALQFGFRPHMVAYALMCCGVLLSLFFFGFETLAPILKLRIARSIETRRVEKEKEQ